LGKETRANAFEKLDHRLTTLTVPYRLTVDCGEKDLAFSRLWGKRASSIQILYRTFCLLFFCVYGEVSGGWVSKSLRGTAKK
jgi:hypothetical protein